MDMIYIYSVLSGLFALFCIYLYQGRRWIQNLVYMKHYFWLFAVTDIVTCVVVIVIAGDKELLDLFWLAFGVNLLSLIGLVSWCNETITFDDQGFFSKNIFGRRQYFRYEDITGLQMLKLQHKYNASRLLHIYIGKKKISVDVSATNYGCFVKKMKDGYKKAHNGGKIPTVQNKSFWSKLNQ